MNEIISQQQMSDHILKCLDDAVKDCPEKDRETTKIKLLNAFSVAMFKGPKEQEQA